MKRKYWRTVAVFTTIAVGFLAIVLGCTSLQAQGTQVPDMPMGQSAQGEVNLLPEDVGTVEDENLFGFEGGYFHPYISLTLGYTDNLYNLDGDNEVDSVNTTISPGIWFALPRKKVIPITINPHNSSPGGLMLQLEDYQGTDRFQAYGLGGLDYNIYSRDSDLNSTNGVLEGLLRWNMRGGLALQAVERYTRGEDMLDYGALTRDFSRRYDSNFFMATADWNMTEKLRVQVDYFNFLITYDDELNQFLDRTDNGFDLYGYFNYSPMTAFFVEYKLVDVSYDDSTQIDNQSRFIYGGIKWDTTEKLAVLAKAGYQDKVFDSNDLGQEDFGGIALDVQFTYRYSEKTLLELDLYRTNEETDNYLASDKTVVGATLKYSQKFTDRLSATIDGMFEDAEYSNFNALTGENRDDTRWSARPAVQYLMREWLMFELAYKYENRDSTDDLFDFATNTIFVSVNLAL